MIASRHLQNGSGVRLLQHFVTIDVDDFHDISMQFCHFHFDARVYNGVRTAYATLSHEPSL